MGLRRLLLLAVFVLALLSAGVVVSNARALAIADDPCPDAAGQNTNTCPPGTVGIAYSIKFHEAAGSGCGPGKQTFKIDSGTLPPGLTLALSGLVTGTPTQAGKYMFYIKMSEPQPATSDCAGTVTERQFTLVINSGVPALPKLTLGPESAAAATTGSPYSLQMTATVSDAKTFSISTGALPPGLSLNSTTGLVSGTPTAAGTYSFTVFAKVNGDSRSDTKALQIVVRDPLTVTTSEPFTGRRAQAEVTVPFDAPLAAAGGSGTYTWSLSTGSLPPGLTFADGAITGTPETPGSYPFVVSAADTEGRKTRYTVRIVVAHELSIATNLLRRAKVGRRFGAKLKTSGGVKPTAWRVAHGRLPRGVRFDRTRGVLVGTPTRSGRNRVTFEATDALGVSSKKTLTIIVSA